MTDQFECPACNGVSEFKWSSRGGEPRLLTNGCDSDCPNNPANHPDALREAYDEHVVVRSEAAYERQFATYHGGGGPLSLQEQVESTRALKRAMR